MTSNEIRRMNDVKFISDLFISMMNGIQDKTKEMDKYYEQYETDFPNKVKWHRLFNEIIETINKIFPDLRNTRWRNKSDFYTLFIVLREILEKEYIPDEKYEKLQNDLMEFSGKVDKAVGKEAIGTFSRDVKAYANAVKKSTTDKDRRLTRHKIISNIISKYAKKRR